MLGLKSNTQMKAEFEQLAMPCLDGLYASALRLTHSDRDAEDLVQDAFMRAYRFFDKFERGTNFRAWLFKILTNTFINKYRRQVKERTFSGGFGFPMGGGRVELHLGALRATRTSGNTTENAWTISTGFAIRP